MLFSDFKVYTFFILNILNDDIIFTYNPHFSPLQDAQNSGQRTFISKIVANQIVPWGWIAVIKPGNCYQPYEKDTEINSIRLQISAILIFVPLQ